MIAAGVPPHCSWQQHCLAAAAAADVTAVLIATAADVQRLLQPLLRLALHLLLLQCHYHPAAALQQRQQQLLPALLLGTRFVCDVSGS